MSQPPPFIFAVDMQVYDSAVGGERTLRFATEGFNTAPSDTPSHAHYDERLVQAIDVARSMFANGSTYGRSTLTKGDIVLANADGALDFLLTLGFDGRAVTVKRGRKGGTLTPVFSGTMLHPEFSTTQVVIKLRDRHVELLENLQFQRFAGTNVGSTGLEGTAATLGTKPKPILLGKVRNISPPSVNDSLLIRQLSVTAVETISAVRDEGIVLPAEAPYVSVAEMRASSPSASSYRHYYGAEGTFIRLGSPPAGRITVDAESSIATPVQCFAWVMSYAGLAKGDAGLYPVSSSDIAIMDSKTVAKLSLFYDDDVTITAVLDFIANTVGAWWGEDISSDFRFARLEKPTLPGMVRFTENEVVGPLERLQTQDGARGVPAYAVTIQYAPNFTVQKDGLALGVSSEDRVLYGEEYRGVTAEDVRVLTMHPLAEALIDATAFADMEDAQEEAERRLLLRRLQRHRFQFRTEITDETINIDIGQTVTLRYPRFGLELIGDERGRAFVVLGVNPVASKNMLGLTLWGNAFETANRVTEDREYRYTEDGSFRLTEVQ